MKKDAISSFSVIVFLVFGLFLLNFSVTGQETSMDSSSLPDNINKIVTFSCMPCHSSKGGLIPKSKLNFTEWTRYSPEKQKNRAEKMYSELEKGAMPPKSAREKRPEIVPAGEQIEIIKKWAESLRPESK